MKKLDSGGEKILALEENKPESLVCGGQFMQNSTHDEIVSILESDLWDGPYLRSRIWISLVNRVSHTRRQSK